MRAIPLQSMSDDEFAQLVRGHTAHLSTLLAALEECRVVGSILQQEATRRATERAAVPNRVRGALRAIADNSR